MEFFTDTINLLQAAIIMIGFGTAIVGVILYGQAHTSDDAQKKNIGINTIIGGIIIALAGIILVPKISEYIPTAAIQVNSFMAMHYFKSFF